MTLSPFAFVVLALGVYRAARIISTDDVSEAPRLWLADRLGEDAWLVRLIECPFCSSWWLSILGYSLTVVALGRVHDVPWLLHAVECWGIMGGAAILSALDGKLTE